MAFILSVYIFGLTFFPCGDVHGADEEHSQWEASHDHDEGEDDCSPMCYCQCCHTSVILTLPELPTFTPIYLSELPTSTIPAIPDSPVESLFRPPQV